MRFGRNLFAFAGLAMLVMSVSTFAGTVKGTVKFEGTAPKLRPIKMDADPGCAKKHSAPVMPELLVLGDGNAMANIFVRVKSVPGTHKAPSQPVVLDSARLNDSQMDPPAEQVTGILFRAFGWKQRNRNTTAALEFARQALAELVIHSAWMARGKKNGFGQLIP